MEKRIASKIEGGQFPEKGQVRAVIKQAADNTPRMRKEMINSTQKRTLVRGTEDKEAHAEMRMWEEGWD